ncbi:DUF503 domain-containing protein [candidate division KSB1 bacterium]|nr:DUF503 domain-containing protein [candidate division KSB1 bacterium]
MLVAVVQLELFFPESGSLKEKRFVLQSIKTRVRQKFNFSVAEVDENDKWQKSVIGLSMVANERKILDQAVQKALDLIEADGRVIVVNKIVEVI